MRLWLNRTGEVTLREQLTTQVVLGILCRELSPGERLPSTRELARRFGIHPNTASAAYRQLEHEGWLEIRHGSGVYVRAMRPKAPRNSEVALESAIDEMIGDLMVKARKLGAMPGQVESRDTKAVPRVGICLSTPCVREPRIPVRATLHVASMTWFRSMRVSDLGLFCC